MRVTRFVSILVFFLLQAANLFSADLNRLMQYATAGRLDLAKEECRELLKQELTEDKRALVLYDLATIYLALGYLNEAEATFKEVDRPLLQSKTVREYAAQNQILVQLFLMQRKMTLGVNGKDPQQVYDECMEYLKNAQNELSDVNEERQKPLSRQMKYVEANLYAKLNRWKIEKLGQEKMYGAFCARLLEKEKKVLISYEKLPFDTPFRQAIKEQVLREVEWFLQANSLKNGIVFELYKEALKELKTAKDSEIALKIENMRFLTALFADVGNSAKLIRNAFSSMLKNVIFEKQSSQVIVQFNTQAVSAKKKWLLEIIQAYKDLLQKSASLHASEAFSLLFEEELLSKVEALLGKEEINNEGLLYLETLYQNENKSFKALFEKKSSHVVWQALSDRIEAKQKTFAKVGKKEASTEYESVLLFLKEAEAYYPQKTYLIQAWLQVDDRACFKELISLYEKEQDNSAILKWILFAWQKQKMHFYDIQLENKGQEIVELIEELLSVQKEGLITSQGTLFTSFCVERLEYLLFFQDQFTEDASLSIRFCIGFEEKGLIVIDAIEKMKTANTYISYIFLELLKMYSATAESFLMQIASLPLKDEQEKERRACLELLAMNPPTLETVQVQRQIHLHIKKFLEKLLTNYSASSNSSEEKDVGQGQKNKNTNSQELLRKNMQIQPDVARSQLLQMEEEDKAKKEVFLKGKVRRPW